MNLDRPCLFGYTKQQIYLKKKNFNDICHKPILFQRKQSIFWVCPQLIRFLSQKEDWFVLRFETYFCPLLSSKSSLSNSFLINDKKGSMRIEPISIFKVDAFIYLNTLNLDCQSIFSKPNSQRDDIFYPHPVVKEVVDYLGGAFSIF